MAAEYGAYPAGGSQGGSGGGGGSLGGAFSFNPKLIEAQVKEDVLTTRAALQAAGKAAAQQAAAKAATMATTPLLNDDTINKQPDVESGGGTFTDSLEESALTGIDTLFGALGNRIAGNGRMPNDPANPNFGGLPRGTTATTAAFGGSTGLLIVIVILWVLFK